MNEFEILLADTDISPVFVSLGNFNLAVAPGAAGYTGETVPLVASNVRLVQFNILSSHGGDNGFAGLSEVRFDGTPVPEPGSLLLTVFGVFMLTSYRRRPKA